MTYTPPSKPIVAVDIPEIKITGSRFSYNFFIPNESISEEGVFVISHSTVQPIPAKKELTAQHVTKAPRYVEINFQPINVKQESQNNATNTVSIFDNYDTIMFEHDFSSERFTGLGLQDTGLDKKLFELFSGSLNIKLKTLMNPPQYKPASPPAQFSSKAVSVQELANYLSEKTSVEKELLNPVLANPEEAGFTYIEGEKKNTEKVLTGVRDIKIKLQLNNNVIFDAAKSVIEDPITLYSDEFMSYIGKYASIQEGYRSQVSELNDGKIDTTDYDSVTKFISIHKENNAQFQHRREIVGYVADKYEITSDGSYIKKAPVIIENPNAVTLYDPLVRYGARYVYQLRTIALVTFEAIATNPKENQDDIYVVKTLVSSQPSSWVDITCTESVPPKPPSDFKIGWDYNFNKPRLTWNFPVTKQRDVKQFQIFRRRNIQEPFQLIRQYNFDDSAVKFDTGESPEPMLVSYFDSPKTFYVDSGFKMSDSYIYALCCIDAHGMSSNYSMQFMVSFDRLKNKVVTKLISQSGAPKALPNMFVQEDAFVDVIKSSGFDGAKIYFDPDYLKISKIIDNIGIQDISPLATDKDQGSYVFQLINTDVQKLKKINIKIEEE